MISNDSAAFAWMDILQRINKFYPADSEKIRDWVMKIDVNLAMAGSVTDEYIESLTEIERLLLGLYEDEAN